AAERADGGGALAGREGLLYLLRQGPLRDDLERRGDAVLLRRRGRLNAAIRRRARRQRRPGERRPAGGAGAEGSQKGTQEGREEGRDREPLPDGVAALRRVGGRAPAGRAQALRRRSGEEAGGAEGGRGEGEEGQGRLRGEEEGPREEEGGREEAGGGPVDASRDQG